MNIPVIGEYDVVVVGGGPGGLGAAVAAARQGAQTLLIEKHGHPGGTATLSFVGYLIGFTDGKRQIIAGIADQLIRELDGMGEAAFRINPTSEIDPNPIGNRPLTRDVISSIEAIKVVYNRMLSQANVHCLFYSTMIGCITQDRRIQSVVVNNIEGIGQVLGKTFIDATGDAHVVHRAGGQVYQIPDESAMTKTIFAHLGGVENFHRPECEKSFYELIKQGDWPLDIQDRFMSFSTLHPNEIYFHVNAAVGNALRSDELTRMDRELREQLIAAVEWFKTKIPGFSKCYLIDAGSSVGIRAGRCIEGLSKITIDSLSDETPTQHPICLGTRATGGAHYIKHFTPPWKSKGLSGIKGIPLEAIIPVSFDNVTVAGRCISHQENVSDSFRTMARCIAIGEGAGITSALAALNNLKIPDVNYSDIRNVLLTNNAILEESQTRM